VAMHLRKGAGHAPKAAAAVAILAAAIAAGHDTVLGTECLSEVDDKDDSYCECAAHQDLGDELELNTKDELEHVADHEGDLPREEHHQGSAVFPIDEFLVVLDARVDEAAAKPRHATQVAVRAAVKHPRGESAASGCLPRHRPGDWGGVHHRLNLDRAGLDSPRNGLDLDHHGLGRGLFIDREG